MNRAECGDCPDTDVTWWNCLPETKWHSVPTIVRISSAHYFLLLSFDFPSVFACFICLRALPFCIQRLTSSHSCWRSCRWMTQWNVVNEHWRLTVHALSNAPTGRTPVQFRLKQWRVKSSCCRSGLMCVFVLSHFQSSYQEPGLVGSRVCMSLSCRCVTGVITETPWRLASQSQTEWALMLDEDLLTGM